MSDVMVLAEHADGVVSDATFELLGEARRLAAGWGGRAVAVVLGGGNDAASALGGADLVVTVDHPALASYTPEAFERALLGVVRERSPRLVLLANTTVGLDLGAALATAWDAPMAAYVSGLEAEGGSVVATCQILGGKMMAEVVLEGDRAVATVLTGSFPAEAGRSGGAGTVETASPPENLDGLRTTFVSTSRPEGGDVDITAADLLVSVGRGIGGADNVELVQELADALGAPLSASRPVVDAGWLPKTRQVGKSGLTVKPKAYLAFGISGAPEHLEGMRDAELVVACNTDPKAPIFDVAHYGTTVDLFDLVPALTDQLRG